MIRKNNQYVDLLKGISCIIVVLLHCPFPGVIGDGIIYGLRFSVPVFFMISGYYSHSKSEKWIINKAIYILKMIVFAEFFYGGWRIVQGCFIQKNTIQKIIESNINDKNLIEIIFCGTLFNGTLWYLYAMFWTWIIIWLFRKKMWLNKVFWLIPLLLSFQIFGRFYIQSNYDINRWVILFRNAITFGLPFTLFGIWIAKHEAELLKKISIKNNLGIIMGGLFLIVIEYFAVGQYMDTHISTVIIAFGLFLYTIRQKREANKYLGIFTRIGSVWYVWIYLLHSFVAGVIEELYKVFQVEGHVIGQAVFPIVVCILSCICSEIIVRFRAMMCKGIKY